jgi:hypothetical protein
MKGRIGSVIVLADDALCLAFLPWLTYAGAVLTGISLSLIAVYLATKRWSLSSVVLVKRREHRMHWGRTWPLLSLLWHS